MTIFNEQTGTNNPFDGINVDSYSKPTLADIDNDGDAKTGVSVTTDALENDANPVASGNGTPIDFSRLLAEVRQQLQKLMEKVVKKYFCKRYNHDFAVYNPNSNLSDTDTFSYIVRWYR